MTTKFDTKQDAIRTACIFAGVDIEAMEGVIPKKDVEYSPLDIKHKYPNEIEIYTIKNKNGDDAQFAIGKFRDGFDLWLLADDRMMVRV